MPDDQRLDELESENSRLKAEVNELTEVNSRLVVRSKVAWGLWIAGTIVVALSWFHVVDTTTGWLGFLLAICGTVWGTLASRE